MPRADFGVKCAVTFSQAEIPASAVLNRKNVELEVLEVELGSGTVGATVSG